MTDVITSELPHIADVAREARAGATQLQVTKPAPERLWFGSFHALLWDGHTVEPMTVRKGQMGLFWEVAPLGMTAGKHVQIIRRRIDLSVSGPDTPPWPTPHTPPPDSFFFDHTTSKGTSWLVAHELGGFPTLTVQHDGGETVKGEVLYVDENSLTLVWSAPVAGKAFFKLGTTN